MIEQRHNYDIDMQKVIEGFGNNIRPKLLLHSCCAPCSTAVIEKLEKYFNLTIFYYNPNIFPDNEFEKRKNEQIKYIKILNNLGKNIKFLEKKQKYDDFLQIIRGFETNLEGGQRCEKCIEMRLLETAKTAKENAFDYFCTTLSVSPHKNSTFINQCGLELQKLLDVKFLPGDFKKNNGFLRSVQLAKENGIYRQDYCGCEFSKWHD